jgi:arylesterase/paraoxonase
MTKRRSLYLGLTLAAALLLWLGVGVLQAGALHSVTARGTEGCAPLPGVVGGEDLLHDPTALPANGGVFWIAADDRRATAANAAKARGSIYRIVADATGPAIDVTPPLPFAFHPHGLGLARVATAPTTAAGTVTATLAVVNHRAGGVFATQDDAVELFDVVDDQTLRHRRSVQDPTLRPMNDVAPIDGDRFYATLDHGNASGPLRYGEELLRLPLAAVAYFDGTHARRVVTGLGYANGVAVSADRATVWVAATTEMAVYGYERDQNSGDLREKLRFAVGTGVDNIHLDSAGDLWLGAHPNLIAFLRHAADPAVLSPTQVLRLARTTGAVEVVLEDDGGLLSGGAAAARATLADGSTRLLVGPVFAPHLLDCRRPAPSVDPR